MNEDSSMRERARRTVYDEWAKEFLRSIRGPMSAKAMSAKLGFKSDVVSRWERGARELTALDALKAMRTLGLDPCAGLSRFDEFLGHAARAHGGDDHEQIAFLLRSLCERTATSLIANALAVSPRSVERLLSGELRPRLATLLLIVDVSTARAIDFVLAMLGDRCSERLLELTRRRCKQARVAVESPASEAILALLRGEAYKQSRGDAVLWLSERLRLAVPVVQQTVRKLIECGLVTEDQGRLRADAVPHIDVRLFDPSRSASTYWIKEMARRTELDPPPRTGFLIFGTTHKNAQRIYQVIREAYQQCVDILHEDVPSERVMLLTMGIAPLDGLPLALFDRPSASLPADSNHVQQRRR
jgi:transcriptional regulator with XRE-family HTH domain